MNQTALVLLLRIAEFPDMRFSGAVLADRHSEMADELIRDGLIVEDGWRRTIEDHDGLHPLEYDEARGGYGYFSPSEGWLRVDPDRIRLYRLQRKPFVISMLGQDLRMTGSHPRDLKGGEIFEVGTLSILGRHQTSIWLARRLHEWQALRNLEEELANRPSGGTRLVLTSTRRDILPGAELKQAQIVSIHDVASADSEPWISGSALRSRLLGEPVARENEGLWVADDGSMLRAPGEQILFSGAIQKQMIRRLYDAYRNGQRIKLEKLRSETGSGSRDLQSVFKRQWQRIQPLLDSENGYYTLKLPD